MPEEDKPIDQQAREQTGQRQVRLRIDERNMASSYANACRTSATPEEVVLDFGINSMPPAPSPQQEVEILFQASNRIVMNWYSAKRLAIALAQLVRRHEQQFGELELDVAKRRRPGG